MAFLTSLIFFLKEVGKNLNDGMTLSNMPMVKNALLPSQEKILSFPPPHMATIVQFDFEKKSCFIIGLVTQYIYTL
jgi:hypothetical protein